MENQLAVSPKTQWQIRHRKDFKNSHGYSESCHYGAGGNRLLVLIRDGYKCVQCGMTDDEHKRKWGRPITIDHKDKNRKNNSLNNLQTLCLSCHGRKDLSPELKVTKITDHKVLILCARANGETYQSIAKRYQCSSATVYKWIKKWKGEI